MKLDRRRFMAFLAVVGISQPNTSFALYEISSRSKIKSINDELLAEIEVTSQTYLQGQETDIEISNVKLSFYPDLLPYQSKNVFFGILHLNSAGGPRAVEQRTNVNLTGYDMPRLKSDVEPPRAKGSFWFTVKNDSLSKENDDIYFSFNFTFADKSGQNFMIDLVERIKGDLMLKEDGSESYIVVSSPASILFLNPFQRVVHIDDLFQKNSASGINSEYEKDKIDMDTLRKSSEMKLVLVKNSQDNGIIEPEELFSFSMESIVSLLDKIPQLINENKDKFLKEKAKERRGACIISTAACGVIGLQDNCLELQILRKFRDDYLDHDEVEDYYRISRKVLSNKIMKTRKGSRYLLCFYFFTMLPCILMTKLRLNYFCKKHYKRSVYKLLSFT